MFRNSLREGKLFVHTAEKISRWQKTSGRLKMPVCIIIGLGGTPDRPSRMFRFDLKDIKRSELFPSFYERHEIDPRKPIASEDLGMIFR